MKMNCGNIVIFIMCFRMRIYMPIWIQWAPLFKHSKSIILMSISYSFYFSFSIIWSSLKFLVYSATRISVSLISLYIILFIRQMLKDSMFSNSTTWKDLFRMDRPAELMTSSISTSYLFKRNCNGEGILFTITMGLSIYMLQRLIGFSQECLVTLVATTREDDISPESSLLPQESKM